MNQTATVEPSVYQRRRAELAKSLARPLLLLAGHATARSYPTNPHPFRANSSYLYFGGPIVEGAALLIEPNSDGRAGSTLLRPAAGPDDALWFGEIPSDDELAAWAGLDRKAILDADRLDQIVAGTKPAVICPPSPPDLKLACGLGLEHAGEAELLPIIEMRLIKDEAEVAAMQRAADIAIAGHRAALAATKPGRNEAEIEAAFHHALFVHRARPSFTPIVTVRGEVLHGASRGLELTDGAFLLVDAGAEEPGGYASDITRTFPVNGRFTGLQQPLYESVERAEQAAIAACTPGRRYREVHLTAARVLTEGLVEVGLLRGAVEDLVERGSYTLFFPHGVGHLLGLDAHDMEDFGDLAGYPADRSRPTRFGDKSLRLDRNLAPGMVVTIEPGFYIVPAIWQRADLVDPLADTVDKDLVNELLAGNFGGIRIEDDILVTEGTPRNLSEALPTKAEDLLPLIGTA
jgi:Xaa-Pro aminopeptidase